ncbi:hypothetical protein D3C77_430290 [compost metagenome]
MRDDRVWVIAAHDGVVIRDTDVLLSKADADELVIDIKRRHPHATFIVDENDATPYLNARTRLLPVRTAYQKVPLPLKIGGAILLGLMLLDMGWSKYKKHKLEQELSQQADQYIDARAEWNTALSKWAADVKVDGRKGLVSLYDHITNVPMKIGGWNLSNISCSSVPEAWSCIARYEASVLSTNITFSNSLPPGWTARWDGLTTAVGRWSFPTERKAIDRKNILTIPDFSLRYISDLQRVLPAFRKVELAPPALVEIATPQVSIQNGKRTEVVSVPYPADNVAGIELPKVQTFKLSGPLRSLSVLPLINEAVINQIVIDVEGRGSVPTLRDSMFTAEITGESYVR